MRYTIAVLITLWSVGCATHPKLSPKPIIYGPGRMDLCSIVPETRRSSDFSVFYATNRQPKGPMNDRTYGNGVDQTLHLGVASVQMGKDGASWDEVCKPGADPAFRVTKASEASESASFYKAIDEQLAISPNHEVNIYVHGFKTWFTWETEILAKLAHCSGRRGAVVCFSWPARQSLYLYGGDVERGKASAHHLADLIEQIAANTKVEHINVMAYSCGASVVTDALLQLRERHRDETPEQLAKRLHIGNVIFAASDIDMNTFVREQIEKLKELSQHVVIYISSNDAALKLASVSYGASRLGRPDTAKFTKEEQEEAAKDPKIQIVDVSDVPGPHNIGGLRGHGYWYANEWIMTDLLVTFRWQIAPDQRGLYRKAGMARWFFPKDYPEKITAAVKQMTAATTP